jgi:hypothetical protein
MIFPDDDTPTPAVHVPAALRVYAGLPPLPVVASRPAAPMPSGTVAERLRPLVHLLGVETDAEIARRANVSDKAVWSARRARGIPPRPRSAVHAYRHLLGEVDDTTIARRAGVTVDAVRTFRVRRGK